MSLKKIVTRFVNYTNGPPKNMFLAQRDIYAAKGSLLMKVKAIGLNRAQCLHREGKYKISRPIQAFLGLEASGQVYDPQTNEKIYDGIALLSGGSYSEWVQISPDHVMPLPKNFTYVQGAAIPEAWLTAFQLLRLAKIEKGKNIVIYAGASGVGTAVIQLGKLLGANIWSVVSSQQKGKICTQLGASGVVYYQNNPNWAKQLIELKQGQFDAVLDCVGSSNYQKTIQLLGIDGHWVLFGLLSGGKTQLNLASLLAKRINLISTTLKTRSDEYKTQLINNFKETALWGLQQKKLKPIIYKTLICDWSSAQSFIEGHELMQSNANFGKIIIEYK